MAAVFSFPLQVGAARLGALSLYQERPGPLDDDRYADVVVMAGVLIRAILGVQAGALDAALGVGLYDIGGDSAGVHQASGMVSAQLDIGVGEALPGCGPGRSRTGPRWGWSRPRSWPAESASRPDPA